ncbi:TRAP transporter, DctM subunit [Roseovarius azorensis]|uniref:TRAP transporter large permease protein n=1 Tax=Roseovarius azorensis TaxID=1287727 RepID=A0A1H7QE33_9RHOB|nr:TRAP transporter large permease subunit [Roseovarius azorensis]SEL46350.1 TRAP transporter, DctM subunit [Roseovarius azorensis]
MDIGSLSLLLVGSILLLLSLGVPLAFAAALVGLVLGYSLFGIPGIILLMQRVYSISTEYILLSVPLFLLMAALLERSGIAREMFNALDAWTGRIRGGVLIVTALMGTIMAAMSGIIGGEIVILGLVALPQMLRLGYNRKLSIGMTCAAGSLGTMLPPSVVLIVYGLVAGTSISDLFLAGIIPGLLLATGYIAYALGRCHLQPEMAPKVDRQPVPFADKMRASKGMIAPVLLVGVIFGFIYGGVTSITEAAAMAALLTFVVVSLRGEMTWVLFSGALKQTLVSIGVILWVTFGATMLTGSFSLAGGPSYIARSITELGVSPFATILVILLLFVILGMFIDWIGILLLTMPVLIPVVSSLGYDLIWFGILFCLTMQISYLTPPFGPAAFYLKSVVPEDISIVEIFHSFIPFIVIQIVVIALVLLFPQLSLALL